MDLTSPLPSSTAVSLALTEFQASLTNERKAHLLANCSVPCALDVLTFTAELDHANAVRKRRGVASRFCTILESIQQYSAVMDTYSQVKADTTSLIWGSLKLCIHVASSAASYYDRLSEWFMRLGILCPRFSQWQSLFPHHARLRKALDAFYATVIRFCAKAVHVLDRSGIMNFLSTFWRPFELEFAALEKDLKQQRAEIDDEIRLASAQVALQEREDASSFREGISRKFTLWRSADETRNRALDASKSLSAKQRLLERLSSYDHKAALNENRKKRHGSSCSWLPEQPVYRQWLADPQSSIFWLSGGVGCGKSVLCAATIDDLLRNHVRDSTAMSFFFCKVNDAEAVSAATILRSLIRQCLTAGAITEALQARLLRLLTDGAPDARELTELFATVSHIYQTHFVVIDGFDECPLADQRAVLDVLGGITKAALTVRLKLFVACRDSMGTHGQSLFPSRYPLAIVQKHVDADIAAYVEDTLQSKIAWGDLLVGSPELVEDIKCALVKGANGMFLWVAFQIMDICEQICDKDIRRVITELPKGLEETYRRILARVVQRGKAGVAERVFCWAGAARRPLTLDEMHEAIAVEVGQKSFQRDQLVNGFQQVGLWCGNLVTVDEENHAVQFAHASVKQYLSSAIQRFNFRPDDADTQLGQACVTYLCFADFERQLVKTAKFDLSLDPAAVASASLAAACGPAVARGLKLLGHMRKTGPRAAKLDALARLAEAQRIDRLRTAGPQQFAFLAYASEHWIAHTRQFSMSTPAWAHFRRLVADDGHFAGLAARLQSSDDGTRLVRYIAEHEHKPLLANLRDWQPRLFAHHMDALFQVTLRQDLPGLTLLLLECVDPKKWHLANDMTIVKRLDDWLYLAAGTGQASITGRLIDMGADIAGSGNVELTVMQVAAQNGHLAVVHKLVEEGADIGTNLIGEGGQVILQAASMAGDIKLIELLVDAKATFDSPSAKSAGRDAIRAAAEANYLALAEKLVYAGASASGNEIWSTGSTFLQVAVEEENMELVDRLLEAEANINAPAADDGGRTALQGAASVGNMDLVKRLLYLGAQVNASPAEHLGLTVLQAAARSGNLAMVQLLLDAGADVNAEPAADCGRTALQAAVEAGHAEIALLLLRAGAHVNAPPAEWGGMSALDAATHAGSMQLTETLVDAGATLYGHEAWPEGWTLLQAAAQAGRARLLDQLLRAGADVNARAANDDGRTALQAAAGAGHFAEAVRLRGAGADVNARPAKVRGRTALQAAAEARRGRVAEYLISAGADVNARPAPYFGKTALQAAAGAGDMDMVKRVLAAGAIVNAEPAIHGGQTALQAAAGAGHFPVVRHLLTAGAAVNAPAAAVSGKTALRSAIDCQNWDVVKFLLDAGADVTSSALDGGGGRALYAAAKAGGAKILNRLLGLDGRKGLAAVQHAASANDVEAAEALVMAGVPATGNEQWSRGRTFLHAAAGAGRLLLVRRLIAAGADVNARATTGEGLTVLQAAAGKFDVEILSCLLNAGADVNAPPSSSGGRTALQAAASVSLKTVERLLAARARVNAEPAATNGRTALQAAVAAGYFNIAQCLVRAGADVYARPAASGGVTALQAARRRGDSGMEAMLVKGGASTFRRRQIKTSSLD